MVKSALLALIIGLASFKAGAQDSYLFTWHGASNYFHATFEVTYDDMMSGTNFESDLFYNSLAVTNPAGDTYFGHHYDYPDGSYIPWHLNVHLYDWQRYTMLTVIGADIGNGHSFGGVIWDEDLRDYHTIWGEQGYWTVSQIPEPSVAALSLLGMIIFIARKRKI